MIHSCLVCEGQFRSVSLNALFFKILNGSSRFAAWRSSTERVWIQFRKIPSIDSDGPCTDFAGLNHVPPLVLHNQQGSTFWWKCRWLKYVKVIEWRKHTKSPTVRDATMGYNGVRKGPPCPVPCAIQEILTDTQLICNYPSWRICPRHHHRAEKLIEPGTKKPLVAYGQLETFKESGMTGFDRIWRIDYEVDGKASCGSCPCQGFWSTAHPRCELMRAAQERKPKWLCDSLHWAFSIFSISLSQCLRAERCRSVQDRPDIPDSSQGIAINVRKPSMLYTWLPRSA